VTWLHATGRELTDADWNDFNLRAIAVHMDGAPSRAAHAGDLLVAFNTDGAPVVMSLPSPPEGSNWQMVFDTSAITPDPGEARLEDGRSLRVGARSTVLLESVPT
jgi:glycogen operon protein